MKRKKKNQKDKEIRRKSHGRLGIGFGNLTYHRWNHKEEDEEMKTLLKIDDEREALAPILILSWEVLKMKKRWEETKKGEAPGI